MEKRGTVPLRRGCGLAVRARPPHAGGMDPGSLDGVRMRVITTAANGVVGRDTLFEFHQEGPVVTAPYRGGKILTGWLAGVWTGPQLKFRYVQVTTGHVVQSGSSSAVLARSPEGR